VGPWSMPSGHVLMSSAILLTHMRKRSIRTFVSYSHEDRAIVEPLVTLLRITRNDVFWDCQSIPLGTVWRKEIDAALNQADIIVVFWCYHSEQSSEVKKEWRAGLALGKRLLPVILDETKMPRSLGEYQAVDFRSIGATHHSQESDEPKKLSAIALPLLLGASLIATAKSAWETTGRLLAGDWSDLLYYAPGSVWLAGGIALIVMVFRTVRWILRDQRERSERQRQEITRMADLLYREVRSISQW